MLSDLPRHPVTGLQAIGFGRRGPIWPVMGGSQPQGEPPAADPPAADPPAPQPEPPSPAGTPELIPEQAGRQPGVDFPENTPVADMTLEQQIAYFRYHDNRKGERLRQLGNVTPDQVQQWRQEAEDARRSQLQPSERALEDARTEATNAATAAAAKQWAPILAEEVIGRFVTEESQRASVLAMINPTQFLKDGTFDKDALIGHLTGLSAAFGGGNGQQQDPPRQWGQQGTPPPAPSASEYGLAEAKRRGHIK